MTNTTDNADMGQVTIHPEGLATVRFERHLAHPPERVWLALTDDAELSEWFCPAHMGKGVGESFDADFGEEGTASGEVLTWDPPRLLEHSWIEAGHRSVVRWELASEDGGTRLLLTHDSLVADNVAEYCAGWHEFMVKLPLHLAGGVPEDHEGVFDERIAAYNRMLAG